MMQTLTAGVKQTFKRLKPCEAKVSCTVSRGVGGSNVSGLLDFAFMGNQYHLLVGGDDFYIDMLFYNVKLRCFVVIELKAGNFKPEYAGKLNFYLSVVDDLLRHPTDNPSIGLILCKGKNNITAEYSLKNIKAPIGLAEYKLERAIPENLKSVLPTIEEIEAELNRPTAVKNEEIS
jgi:hypothetical protein